ncbi:hypothetical protein PZT66_24105 [Pseudomonas aeruginosa]|uniref:hypothetical protein n=2 Tax=Pseudomonas aeruginosa group TaxID=136841 RepID=UPI00044E3458|nr:hypothetical protein [Pseudomonas aeruginosa]EIU2716084.1 hypothetical protein [Pseudomonas aeruginosa]EIU2863625.1 hypothetical protein [Pseudomonas aeruginosa]ELD5772837.1 hypothetical protein [Pseudomonas aeruginosa]ETV28809.1 hypothetical protein Q046_05726 [Pseudomonas aeruginosa BWHPSA041]ETV55920.1 hypothetical protein Q042_05329 [Pseudomonas aeruginosa BWHPSA037]
MERDLYLLHAITALEKIAAASNDFFQARKVGLQLVIPSEVELAYVRKHGEDGKGFIYKLRGDVNL